MHTMLLCVLVAIHTTSAAVWDRDAYSRDDFHSKRTDIADNEQDLFEQIRSLFNHHEKRSWQGYVEEQLVGTGNLAAAAIIGHDGNTWAQSPDFSLKPGEGRAIVQLFKNPGNIFASGVTVNGVKYLGIKGDDRSIYGKKGPGGVILVKTGQTILIGTYNERQQPGNAANAVEKLADYLMENGY